MVGSLLRSGSLEFMDQAAVRRALAHGWCWPVEEALRARALELAARPPPVPAPGEALLISVSGDAGQPRRALWALRRRRIEGLGRAPVHFVSSALESLRRAEQIATRGLPFILSPESLWRGTEWSAELICKEGPGWDEVLDGPSFGLSMLLAAGSLLLDVPLPHDLAASAAVRDDGTLEAVDGLAEKISLVAGSALGVRRLLVVASQVDEARALARSAGAAIEIAGVASAAEAFSAAFEGAHQRVAGGWSPERFRAAAWNLYQLALLGRSPILDWGTVARGAELVMERVGGDALAREEASAARAIARRHCGEASDLRPPSEALLQRLVQPHRDRHLAHVLQAATDAAAAGLPALLESVCSRLPPPRDCYEPQLALHGAAGRALASLRRYPEARDWLLRCVEAWRDLGDLDQASHPLCELIRVSGIDAGWPGVLELRDLTEPALASPQLSTESRGFLHLALGRASALGGDVQAALGWLEDGGVVWERVRQGLSSRRARWLARVLVEVGRGAEAAKLRGALAGHQGQWVGLLVALDEAMEEGRDPGPALQRILESHHGLIAARLVEGAGGPKAQAQRLIEEFPY